MAEAAIFKSDMNRSVKRSDRFLIALILFLILLLLVEIVGQLYILPNLVIRHIEIESDFDISRKTVVDIGGLDQTMYYFNVNLDVLKNRIMEYPLIRDVTINKYFPDKIKISIVGRKPVASALVGLGSRTIPILVDDSGVIFKLGKSVDTFDAPVISGLVFKDLRLGMTLPQRLIPLLHDLAKLKREDPDIYKLISEIKIEPITSTDYELVLFPLSYNIRVRLSNRIDSKTVKYALVILDLLKNEMHADNIEEIDLRNDTMVYKIRRD